MRKILFSVILLAGVGFSAPAKDFVKERVFYKEGGESIRWNFGRNSVFDYDALCSFVLDASSEKTKGIAFWVYNFKPSSDSLQIEILSTAGEVVYRVPFYLKSKGWRACWTSFANMKKTGTGFPAIAGFRIIPPEQKGSVLLDRITFPVEKVNARTTPDMQMPHNNDVLIGERLWHWCRTYEWSRYQYEQVLPERLSETELREMEEIEGRLLPILKVGKGKCAKALARAVWIFDSARIRECKDGCIAGLPLVDPDERNSAFPELTLKDVNDMLIGFALDAYHNGNADSADKYFLVWRYAIDQGFAYGSGMGTNHHYGYKLRDAFASVWLLRDEIRRRPEGKEILATVEYWSAIREACRPFEFGRDGAVDTWNTLLLPKVIAALMYPDRREQYRSLAALSRWVSGSIYFTTGTSGGFKVDGTGFHHGGFYPAYTVGAVGALGQYVHLMTGTGLQLDDKALGILKKALQTMRNYCNLTEWAIGISGRHPFSGGMKEIDIQAFASLSRAKDFSGRGEQFDRELAADYLRLCREDTKDTRYFRKNGVQPSAAPSGFWVYNYGSAGIFRGADWMVTLKGYTTDVWGSEIYVRDNRYGRYQSYGSVQIFGYPSRKESGFVQEGWDWNRLPGTTTVHLPFEELDSPLPHTTMAKSTEDFSGASSLQGRYGLFTMKLMERELERFTPDHRARKTVLCCDNRMVLLGTDISNGNNSYPTETTLFQTAWEGRKSDVSVDGSPVAFGSSALLPGTSRHCLSDGYGNYYFVAGGNDELSVCACVHESRDEKTRKPTSAAWSCAYLNHGKAPRGNAYEYMVLIQPGREELHSAIEGKSSYHIFKKDKTAHILKDIPSGVTACSFFEEYTGGDDGLLVAGSDAETILMYRDNPDGSVSMSICFPGLNIEEKAFNTSSASRPLTKSVTLRGNWSVSGKNVTCLPWERDLSCTRISVVCVDGQPVEFTIRRN